MGMVYGRNVYQHSNPKCRGARTAMAMFTTMRAAMRPSRCIVKVDLISDLGGVQHGRLSLGLGRRQHRHQGGLGLRPAGQGNRFGRAEGHSRMPFPGHVETQPGRAMENAAGSSAHVSMRPGSTPAKSPPSAAPAMATGSTRSTMRASASRHTVARHPGGGACRRVEVAGGRRPDLSDRPATAWAFRRPPLFSPGLKRHRPEVFASIGTVFLCKDFIVNRLTGTRVSDVSDMTGCGLLTSPAGLRPGTHGSLRALRND